MNLKLVKPEKTDQAVSECVCGHYHEAKLVEQAAGRDIMRAVRARCMVVDCECRHFSPDMVLVWGDEAFFNAKNLLDGER